MNLVLGPPESDTETVFMWLESNNNRGFHLKMQLLDGSRPAVVANVRDDGILDVLPALKFFGFRARVDH